ncbi:MAG: hypothetical protein CML17_06845 [Pusillimonas sp.]|nr:hypothetical protein [Pusillimonas sp.]
MSGGKDPRHEDIDGLNSVFQGCSLKGNQYLINPNNDKMSYVFGLEKDEELISSDNVDFQIPAEVLNEKRNDGKELHKQGLPLSFIQIKTEEEGVEWYKKHYPKIPTDLLPIIARYHWGEPITKKAIKNERKKINKKAEKKGLKILTSKDNKDNPFIIEFN